MPAYPEVKKYFLATGFADLLPLALEMAQREGYGPEETIEAVCMVVDRAKTHPPTRNRVARFTTVFREKLRQARGEIKACERKTLG